MKSATLLQRLGKKVRGLRQERHLSLRLLAARSGVSTRFLSELEAGRANISVVRLGAIAAAFGSTAGALLGAIERADDIARPTAIALLGIRGAGKSTIGRLLARRLEMQFVELDELIEESAGLSLGDIFALHGEDYYRRLETEALHRFLAHEEGGVLATGGGIVTNAEAFRLLQSRSATVWLQASAADHWARVIRQGDLRPMAGRAAARAELRRLLAARKPLYSRAHHRVNTTRLDVGDCVEAILRCLDHRELGGPRPTSAAR